MWYMILQYSRQRDDSCLTVINKKGSRTVSWRQGVKKIHREDEPCSWPIYYSHLREKTDLRLFHGRLYSFLALRTVFALTEHSINKCVITGWMNDAFTICSKPFSIIICKTVYFLTHISHIYLELLFASTLRMKQWGSILLWNQSQKKNPGNQKSTP